MKTLKRIDIYAAISWENIIQYSRAPGFEYFFSRKSIKTIDNNRILNIFDLKMRRVESGY